MVYDNKNCSNQLEISYTNIDMNITNEHIETNTTSKRRSQVKNACVNCQKACKKCDEGRPCQRCIKLGITDTCFDSPRKERKKGFKRGPYRKKSVTTTQQTSLKKESSSSPLFTTSIMVKQEQISPDINHAEAVYNMNNEYCDYPTASSDTSNSQLMTTPNNYYSNNTPSAYFYSAYEECPQESFTNTSGSLPEWTYTDTVEHPLYYNTQEASSFVTKFGDNTIFLQSDKSHHDDSIYNDQQWLDNLYYYPSNMMYINTNPSSAN
ncbi:hypothetical protein INT47_010179 [Mucor saturninus]|uniref:Zn(2)-C6 fungal-type domain-containing protein n=1 Tax=Mucor saturninus TaxID=64648 RepID=A0A8H7REZ0_9FUNG|nr:hypothetical protein INT47_010179 [Mucor saturninus]